MSPDSDQPLPLPLSPHAENLVRENILTVARDVRSRAVIAIHKAEAEDRHPKRRLLLSTGSGSRYIRVSRNELILLHKANREFEKAALYTLRPPIKFTIPATTVRDLCDAVLSRAKTTAFLRAQ